uniref:Carbohydrate kinase FGGY N-terminal domain-containing protein n=1 Tax=Stegastes partitus TaxID=144197 RepID=A0A3B4ZS55_9TELE
MAAGRDSALYLGLDFSTQQLKAVAIDGDLSVVHQSSVQFDAELPHFRYRHRFDPLNPNRCRVGPEG